MREDKTIEQLKNELVYLKKEYNASFKIEIYKPFFIGEIGYHDYGYELFNSVKINKVNNFINEFKKVINNKNLIALLENETGHLDLRVMYTTPKRKNIYKKEYVYENLAYMTYCDFNEINVFTFFNYNYDLEKY
jgi:hypothetical protein